MNRFIIVILFLTFVSCNEKKPNSSVVKKSAVIKKQQKIIDTTQYFDKLNRYFDLYRITPSIEINNVDYNSDDKEVQLGNHKIEWIDSEEETKIKINNDFFSLKNNLTLNAASKNRMDVDFVNDWDEIKLYKHRGKEFLIIRMSYQPCNGLACSADFFLVYDVSTKKKNFFGNFRGNREIELFDFNNDDKVDYVSKTFNGDYHGSTPIEFIHELYSLEKNGEFKLQKDKKGLAYQIKITTFPNIENKMDEYSENWINNTKIIKN